MIYKPLPTTNTLEDQVEVLKTQNDCLFINAQSIVRIPKIKPKRGIYELLEDVRLQHIVEELEPEYHQLSKDEYSEDFHKRVLEIFKTIIETNRTDILRKKLEFLGFSYPITLHKIVGGFPLNLQWEIAPNVFEIEKRCYIVWETVELKSNLTFLIETFKENLSKATIIDLFKDAELNMNKEFQALTVKESVEKSFSIIKNLHLQRVSELKEFISSLS